MLKKRTITRADNYNESRLKAILETVIDGIITIDCKGIIESVNPAVIAIFGYTSDELIGQNVKILMPDNYASTHDNNLKNYLETGEKKVIGIGREVTGKRKDGSFFPLDLAVSEMEVNGEVKFTGIVRDITERKRIEAEIQSGEHRIRTLIETIPDGVIVTNENGCIETFNPAAEKLFKYQFTEIKGKDIRMLMLDPYAILNGNGALNIINSKIAGVSQELIGKRKDNSTFPMELTVNEMLLNGKRYINALVRDISSRKTAELEEGKKRALEISSVFERTQSKVLSFFSTNFDAPSVFKLILTQLSDEHDFPVSTVHLFDEWHGVLECVASHGLPESVSRSQSPEHGIIGEVARTCKSMVLTSPEDIPFQIDIGLFHISPAAVVISPISYRGQVLGVLTLTKLHAVDQNELGFIDNLSKQIGLSLNNLNQFHNMKILSEQLRQRSQEISQKNQLLEKANRLKSEFLANMSHELRTPLNAIIGFSEVLKDQFQNEISEEKEDFINEILSSASHLLSLINDILDLSKIEAGKMELLLEPFNVAELFGNAISIVKEKAYKRKITIHLKLDQQLDKILVADIRKLKQIVFNLLDNAVKFSNDGGSVIIEAANVNNNFLVKITDNGIGIREDKIGLLFSPFEQLDSSLSRQYSGTGLGLALIKRLVELHGGQVSVDSVYGKGSCFYFTIPYSVSTSEPSESVHHNTHFSQVPSVEPIKVTQSPASDIASAQDDFNSTSCKSNACKILVIEDNSQQADLLKLYLEEAGYRVTIAINGNEAIDLLKSNPPDLITLDLLMPDMDGFAFLEFINNLPEFSHIPVVVLSAVSEQLLGTSLVADAILSKPIMRSSLLSLVNNLLPSRCLQKDSPKPKLLLIDDDPKAIKIISSYLPQTQYEVLSAFNGTDGLELARIERPDLIILDLLMPEISGFEVLSALKQNSITRDIPVFVLTSKLLSSDEQIRLKVHVDSIANKSDANQQFLISEISNILKRYNKI